MTSTEVSIRFFERHLKEDILKYGERQAIHMAISALREQEERSKGCEHCRSEINRGLMLAHGYSCCTDCGRRLEAT